MRINVKVDTSAFKGNPMPAARLGITNALRNGAEQVKRTAQELAPRDTGALSESISIHSFLHIFISFSSWVINMRHWMHSTFPI